MKRFKYRDHDDGTFAIHDRIDDEYYFDNDMEDFCELVNILYSSLEFARDTRDKVLNEYNPQWVINIIENMIMNYQAQSLQAMKNGYINRDLHIAQFTLRELIKQIKGNCKGV